MMDFDVVFKKRQIFLGNMKRIAIFVDDLAIEIDFLPFLTFVAEVNEDTKL